LISPAASTTIRMAAKRLRPLVNSPVCIGSVSLLDPCDSDDSWTLGNPNVLVAGDHRAHPRAPC
jgi:hypothetical protein